MLVKNLSKNCVLADNCRVADTFFGRFVGLMGKRNLPENEGLFITPCNSIHMFFMRIPLDVIFVDRDNSVVHLIEGIKPWHVTKLVRKACSVLELPHGTISKSQTAIGDKLSLK